MTKRDLGRSIVHSNTPPPTSPPQFLTKVSGDGNSAYNQKSNPKAKTGSSK